MLRRCLLPYTLRIHTNTYSYNKINSLVLLFSLFYRQEHSSTERSKLCQSSHSYYMAEPVFKPRQPDSHPHVLLPLVFKWMNKNYLKCYLNFTLLFNFFFLSHWSQDLSFYIRHFFFHMKNWSFNPRLYWPFFISWTWSP